MSDIDGIPLRKCIDKSVNQHGQTFVDFLIASKMCVLKGRLMKIETLLRQVQFAENLLLTTGISLLSVVSKLYSAVLNNRLKKHLEDQELLVDEQNGFRSKRSCEDHVYTSCTIIRNRLLSNLDTFGTFIDIKKAFDFVNRDVLLYKLLSNSINGKFYNSIKAILTDTSSCVKLKGMLTDWFPTLSGVKQGDSGSPTIFAYFINDLAEGLKTLNKGVQFNNDILLLFVLC
ncbi:uncharacterized protein LOC132728635 [Ruditapes philippinarum]|uniref:uncharacterized protein LOC132728635 n=1 Tax=Ruditapes philippinarum TaxID=129788 RepID=UPI00295AD26F|nr:uncharacterized protein LOC132728635 [Ruditapes philippinarum]